MCNLDVFKIKKYTMIDKLFKRNQLPEETVRRTIVKTTTYRTIIIILDFVAVYLFTGQLKIAVGYTIVSNIYTTLAYFLHERIWTGIQWGKINNPQNER